MAAFFDIETYGQLLIDSYRHWTGQMLASSVQALYDAPFPVVSHGMQADPVFRYANKAAQVLWETDWDTFTRMPSRQSAEPVADIQDDRAALLKAAMQKGWIDHYRGVRISATGKRFQIADTVLWNVVDAQGVQHGQAARIGSVKAL